MALSNVKKEEKKKVSTNDGRQNFFSAPHATCSWQGSIVPNPKIGNTWAGPELGVLKRHLFLNA